jgi:hypothetical protein
LSIHTNQPLKEGLHKSDYYERLRSAKNESRVQARQRLTVTAPVRPMYLNKRRRCFAKKGYPCMTGWVRIHTACMSIFPYILLHLNLTNWLVKTRLLIWHPYFVAQSPFSAIHWLNFGYPADKVKLSWDCLNCYKLEVWGQNNQYFGWTRDSDRNTQSCWGVYRVRVWITWISG